MEVLIMLGMFGALLSYSLYQRKIERENENEIKYKSNDFTFIIDKKNQVILLDKNSSALSRVSAINSDIANDLEKTFDIKIKDYNCEVMDKEINLNGKLL